MTSNGLRIFHDDFPRKVKDIHGEMEKHHSYKKACMTVLWPLLLNHEDRTRWNSNGRERIVFHCVNDANISNKLFLIRILYPIK